MNGLNHTLEPNASTFFLVFCEVKTGGESLELHLANNVPRLDYSACRSAALQGRCSNIPVTRSDAIFDPKKHHPTTKGTLNDTCAFQASSDVFFLFGGYIYHSYR